MYKTNKEKYPKLYVKNNNHLLNEFTYKNQGILIRLGGRLRGISKAKRIILKKGKIKQLNLRMNLDYYSRQIYTKWGTLGIKICKN